MFNGDLRKFIKYIRIIPPLYVRSCAKIKKCAQTTYRPAIETLAKNIYKFHSGKIFPQNFPTFNVPFAHFYALRVQTGQRKLKLKYSLAALVVHSKGYSQGRSEPFNCKKIPRERVTPPLPSAFEGEGAIFGVQI